MQRQLSLRRSIADGLAIDVLKSILKWLRINFAVRVALMILCPLVFPSLLGAQEGHEDLDAYKVKVIGYWWFARPRGSLQGKVGPGSFPLDSSTGFGDYSTFVGRVDWKFRRKHHLIFDFSPNYTSRSTTLAKTVEFQGITYLLGERVSTGSTNLAFSPGYQYDIIRRRRGHLGFIAQVNLLYLQGHIDGVGQKSGPNGTQTSTFNSSGSLFAPLPVLGPDYRVYFVPHSDRWYLDGFFKGLYFFGYGDFISARTTIAARLTKHLGIDAGYQVGSRLVIDTGGAKARVTQQGPIAGLEFRW